MPEGYIQGHMSQSAVRAVVAISQTLRTPPPPSPKVVVGPVQLDEDGSQINGFEAQRDPASCTPLRALPAPHHGTHMHAQL